MKGAVHYQFKKYLNVLLKSNIVHSIHQKDLNNINSIRRIYKKDHPSALVISNGMRDKCITNKKPKLSCIQNSYRTLLFIVISTLSDINRTNVGYTLCCLCNQCVKVMI